MNDILELEIEKRVLQEQVKEQEKINEEARQKALQEEQEKQDFVNAIQTNFVKLTESTPVTINREEKWASFVYKKETYFVMLVEKWDNTNIPDEGYTPHAYNVWVLRKGTTYHNTGQPCSNEADIALDWRLKETDCYEKVIKGLRELNEPRYNRR